jgi:pentose-5-phosphate-3-epimerase
MTGKEVLRLEPDADMLHVDLSDAHFVPGLPRRSGGGMIRMLRGATEHLDRPPHALHEALRQRYPGVVA